MGVLVQCTPLIHCKLAAPSYPAKGFLFRGKSRMVERALTPQTWQLDEPYLRFTDYHDLGSLERLKLIIQQITIYAQNKQAEKLKILDIGCGRGDISFPLLSLGHLVTGIDISPESISACWRKNEFSGAHFVVADAQSFDLGERFDILVCSEVLEHVSRPDLVVASLDKHLERDGAVIVTTPNGYCLHEILVNRLGAVTLAVLVRKSRLLEKLINFLGVPTDSDYFKNPYQRHLHSFGLSNLKKLFNLHGFQTLSIHNLFLEIPMTSLQGVLRPLQVTLRWLTRIKLKIGKFMPYPLAEGWLLVLNREADNS